MRPKIQVREVFSDPARLRALMTVLTGSDVYIGVPAEGGMRPQKSGGGSAERYGVDINNAYLSYIHEYGVPEKNIPARPHLMPGIRKIQPKAAKILEKALKETLKTGKTPDMATALNSIGLLGQNAVRAMFVDNDWQPLADKTLEYKPLRKNGEGQVMVDKQGNKLRGKSRADKKRPNPLLDTGQLRRAHTYVIKKRRSGWDDLILGKEAGDHDR
jgi:hypothetical protein